jgi:hypothetical protein
MMEDPQGDCDDESASNIGAAWHNAKHRDAQQQAHEYSCATSE